MTAQTTEGTTGRALRPPRAGRSNGQWAVDGRGIVLRSIWQVGPLLREGRLARVLPDHRQEANVWAVYPTRLAQSAKVRVCVEFLERSFAGLEDGTPASA